MIAIDPGSSSGAIAVKKRYGTEIKVFNMPDDPRGILEFLRAYMPMMHSVVMEDVGHGFPGNSAKSMFTFAKHRGHLDMALIACDMVPTLVLPTVWMHQLYGDALPKGQKKDDTKARKDYIYNDMVVRYPSVNVTKRNADALALMTWGLTTSEHPEAL